MFYLRNITIVLTNNDDGLLSTFVLCLFLHVGLYIWLIFFQQAFYGQICELWYV